MSDRHQHLQDLEAQINQAQVSLTKLKRERDRVRQQAQHDEIDRLEQKLRQGATASKNAL